MIDKKIDIADKPVRNPDAVNEICLNYWKYQIFTHI